MVADQRPLKVPNCHDHERATGRHRMIHSLSIENFRGYRHLHLSPLGRINIVVGDNGSGKTALLEALFLVSGSSPELALRVRAWRGFASEIGGRPRDVYEGLWSDLFHGFDTNRIVKVSATGSDHDSRAMRIFKADEEVLLPLELSGSEPAPPYVPITFEWEDATGKRTSVTPQIQSGQISVPSTSESTIRGALLAVHAPIFSQQNASFFSSLSKVGQERRFVKAMQAQFRDIKSISVEIEMGQPMLFVQPSWQERKIPMNVLSDGMTKLASILLHIANAGRGIVCIDEIDDGFHYTRLEKVWNTVLDFATQYGTQVYAATHSLECLQAIVPIMLKRPTEFTLIRAFHTDGICHASIISGADALNVIQSGLEVRG
jgi:hypothetical protein